jgi:hypothetical protein
MRPRGWMVRMLLLLLPLAPSLLLATEPGRTQWKLADFTWVKLVPAEPGAPGNAHPAKLTEATLVAALLPVQVSVEGRDIPVFAKDELAGLTKALLEALSLARPGDDLILLSTHRRGGGVLNQPQGLTARIFVSEGALNLILHDARLDFMDRYLADGTLPAFAYGSRTAVSAIDFRDESALRLRRDWLAIPLAATPAKPATMAPEAQAGKWDAAFFEAQTQRLKALKRLREEDLLSEAEYQSMRQAILKTL